MIGNNTRAAGTVGSNLGVVADPWPRAHGIAKVFIPHKGDTYVVVDDV